MAKKKAKKKAKRKVKVKAKVKTKKIIVGKIHLHIGSTELELTVTEAKKLKSRLDDLFSNPSVYEESSFLSIPRY